MSRRHFAINSISARVSLGGALGLIKTDFVKEPPARRLDWSLGARARGPVKFSLSQFTANNRISRAPSHSRSHHACSARGKAPRFRLICKLSPKTSNYFPRIRQSEGGAGEGCIFPRLIIISRASSGGGKRPRDDSLKGASVRKAPNLCAQVRCKCSAGM